MAEQYLLAVTVVGAMSAVDGTFCWTTEDALTASRNLGWPLDHLRPRDKAAFQGSGP